MESDIKDYYKKRNSLSYINEYRDELDAKRQLSMRIHDLQEKMQFVEFEISTIKDSIRQLTQEKSNIDINLLKKYIQKLNHIFLDFKRNLKMY